MTPDTFRWQPRAYLLFGAGAVLLLVGVVLSDPAPLLLALPVLLAPVAAALLGPRGAPIARLRWTLEGTGPDVRVTGAASVDPPTDANDLDLEFAVPPGLTEEAPVRLERDRHEVRFELRWTARDPIVVPVPFPHLAWRDPAGLVERAVRWDPPPLLVERYPPELTQLGAVRLERTIPLPGETRSRRIGVSGEFFGIRDATPNEPPRRINWLASARAGRLLANEYEVDRTGDVVLLVDARASGLGARVDHQLLSLALAGAHGIAESFLREKARVGLGVFGEFLVAVPLASGRTQRVRLRRALLGVRLAPEAGTAERCAVSMRRYFPPGVTTIVLTSLVEDASSDLVPQLRRRGFPVIVVSPSPLPVLASPRTLSDAEEELVARIARLVRRQRLARTWEDAPVVDWEEYWSLGRLVELFRRPGRRGRGA
ncbi:MAG: DUF58 domain-containing protein [Thermoplasmata archaeon]